MYLEFVKQNLTVYNFKRFLRVLGTDYPFACHSQKVMDCLIIFSMSAKRVELLDGFQSFLHAADSEVTNIIRAEFLGINKKEKIALQALCSFQ
jgi:hypothetical protein